MESVEERFLRYVAFDTQSEPEQESLPSTKKQLLLSAELEKELKELGLSAVQADGHGYVYAFLPETVSGLPALGLIAHLDTAPDCSGKDIWVQKIPYTGGDLLLNPEKQIVMRAADFPALANYSGQTLLCTDGTTLLGADDKAGIAEIITTLDGIARQDRAGTGFPHGRLCVCFTPDEEVGRGTDGFDPDRFGADFAYTVDGGALGELEYENFNAAALTVTVHGINIHPGTAKNKMKNALEIAMAYAALLPAAEKPEYTEGYEGFFHLHEAAGTVEQTTLKYIIRDHDRKKFEEKKQFARQAADFLNRRYGSNTVVLTLRDSYYNMKEKILPHFFLIENAKRAMENTGIQPVIQPIRGGTDGARLSYAGLPCPNLCAGGENFHGRFEFISTQTMEKIVQMLTELIRVTYAHRKKAEDGE